MQAGNPEPIKPTTVESISTFVLVDQADKGLAHGTRGGTQPHRG